jgi:small subunit ribosomal protein S20
MPQHKSCEKRMRTSAKERSRNRAYREKMKRAIREVRDAESYEQASDALKRAQKVLDRIAGKGIIHPNRAADKMSRLSDYVASLRG